MTTRTTPPADWTPAMWERHAVHLHERANRAEALLQTAAEAIEAARTETKQSRLSLRHVIRNPTYQPAADPNPGDPRTSAAGTSSPSTPGVMYADEWPE